MGICTWAEEVPLYKKYHDDEWGVPVHDETKMFEHLMLECLQCGLSWSLMLVKREVFRTISSCKKIEARYGEEGEV